MNKKLKNWFLNSGSTSSNPAQAFISAWGIVDATEVAQLPILVSAFQSAGVYNICDAIYPFIGGLSGSNTSHKGNLRNPADSDAAFRLSFSGGWTHSYNGAAPNGTTGYADTFYNPSGWTLGGTITKGYKNGSEVASATDTETPANGTIYLGARNKLGTGAISFCAREIAFVVMGSGFIGIYSRTAAVSGGYDMGLSDASDTSAVHVITRFSGDLTHYALGTTAYNATAANADGRGFFMAARAGGLMDATKALAMYNAIQTFQTALGRNV